MVNMMRWGIYYALRWPEAIDWCFNSPITWFVDGQIKWERSKGLRP